MAVPLTPAISSTSKLIIIFHAPVMLTSCTTEMEILLFIKCKMKQMKLTQKVLLALESCLQITEGKMGQSKIAVSSSHVHLVLQVLGECQVLIVVPHCLTEVSQAVVCISQEMAGLRLTLYVVKLLSSSVKNYVASPIYILYFTYIHLSNKNGRGDRAALT